MWDALVTTPGIGVHILDDQLRVLYYNAEIARLIQGDAVGDLTGKTIDEVGGLLGADPAAVEDTKKIIRALREGKESVALRRIWRGYQIVGLFRRIVEPGGHRDRFLVITRKLSGSQVGSNPDLDVVDADVVALGPLDVLSPRELEVLCLIGQGLSVKAIARVLHRSPHTIDAHRRSIGCKLHHADRVELARLATEAGLTLADAVRKRTALPPAPSDDDAG